MFVDWFSREMSLFGDLWSEAVNELEGFLLGLQMGNRKGRRRRTEGDTSWRSHLTSHQLAFEWFLKGGKEPEELKNKEKPENFNCSCAFNGR